MATLNIRCCQCCWCLHCCIRRSLSESILGGTKRLSAFSLPTMVETPVLFFLLTFIGILEEADIAIYEWVKLLVKRKGSENVGCGCGLTRMCEFKLQPGGELANKKTEWCTKKRNHVVKEQLLFQSENYIHGRCHRMLPKIGVTSSRFLSRVILKPLE